MPTPIDTLLIKIGVDDKDLTKGVDKAESKFAGLGKQIAGAVSVAAIVQFGRKSLDAFGESERAIAKVEAGLDSMGRTGTWALEDIMDEATRLQRSSLFGDDEILDKVTAQLLTFGNIGKESFNRAQQAAVDLAAKLGGDLQSSAIMVGKALDNPVQGLTALTRVGVTFSDEQKELIKTMAEAGDTAGAQAEMLRLLEMQYGGTAAAVAAAGTGPMDQFNNALGDSMEVVGEMIADFLVPLAATFRDLVYAFQDSDETTQKLTLGLGLVAAAITAVWVATGPIGAAIAGITIALGALYSNWDEVVFFMQESWLQFKAMFLTATAQILGGIESFVNSVIDGVRPVADFLGIDLPDQVSLGADAVKEAADKAWTALGDLRAESEASKRAAEMQREENERLAQAQRDMAAAAGTAAAATGELKESLSWDDVKARSELERMAEVGSVDLPAALGATQTKLDATTVSMRELGTAAVQSAEEAGGSAGALSPLETAWANIVTHTDTFSNAAFADVTNALGGALYDAVANLDLGFGSIGGWLEDMPLLARAVEESLTQMVATGISELGKLIAESGVVSAALSGISSAITGLVGMVGGGLLASVGVIGSMVATIGFTIAGIIDMVNGQDSYWEGHGTGNPETGPMGAGGWTSVDWAGLADQWLNGGMWDDFWSTPPDPGVAGRLAGTGASLMTTQQQITIVLDGRVIGETVVEHMPEVLYVNGI